MAAHSSILAQRIPWTEESGGLQSIRSVWDKEWDTAEVTQQAQDLPGGLVVRILSFHHGGLGSIPGWGGSYKL